ncbi:MAG: VCBS repeat-containing protein [Thermoplasmata archaeon]|nr:VCBS repeat-containing protein [Thermoplasmata archaeon]
MAEKWIKVLVSLVGLLFLITPVAFLPQGGGEGVPTKVEKTRYGFTPNMTWTDNPGFEVWALDTGNFDGGNGPDIAAGGLEKIQIYLNNGQGTNFVKGQTISLPTNEKIVRMVVADVDGDGDDDILAWGIFNDPYSDQSNGVPSGLVERDFRFNYFKNDGSGTFTLQDYVDFSNVPVMILHPYYQDGHWDMAAGDIDNDGDVDAVVVTGVKNSNGYIGTVKFSLLKYSSGSFNETQNITFSVSTTSPWLWGLVDLGDMNRDNYLDLIMVVQGYYAPRNPLYPRIYVQNNTQMGSFVTSLNHVGTVVTSGSRLVCAYDVAHGDFLGTAYPDIIVSSNYDTDGNMISGMLWVIGGLANGGFTSQIFQVHQEIYHWGAREISVGKLDNTTGSDYALSYWYDSTLDDPYDAINSWSISAVSSRPVSYPPGSYLLKHLEPGRDMPKQVYRTVELDNMDRDPAGFDDIIAGGTNVTVFITSYPPPKPPQVVRATHKPMPIHNDGKELMTINITVVDPDGWSDVTYLNLDLRSIGGKVVTLGAGNRSYDLSKKPAEVYFTYKTVVPTWVEPGLYECNITVYDRPGLKGEGKLYVRVEQFNRAPVATENAPREIHLPEDTEIYVEGVYNFFEDPDGDQLLIYLKTESGLWGKSYTGSLITVTLENGTDENPFGYSLHIVPKKNLYGTSRITLMATDGIAESDPLVINVTVDSVNDPPIILGISSPGKFEVKLQEDRSFYGRILAEDPNDGNTEFHFWAEFLEEENKFFINPETGEIRWTPQNDDVGSHRVMIYVDDLQGANVSALFWFNVSNTNDPPFISQVSNGTYTYRDLTMSQVLDFTVYEHQWFNLTLKVGDEDINIGKQSQVLISSDLSFYESYQLTYDPETDPYTAKLSLKIENVYGIQCTYLPKYPPLTANLTVMDEDANSLRFYVTLRITVINVNDPPGQVKIVEPEAGESYDILFHHYFSASAVGDPDIPYNDSIRYVWDFDASDGFQENAVGQSVYWDFPHAGNFTVTVRVYDSNGLYTEDSIYVIANGIYNESDYDNDGLPNSWEEKYGLDIYDPTDANVDTDGDGLTNLQEYLNGTDPTDRDTDRDGYPDGEDLYPTDGSRWKAEKKEKKSPISGLVMGIIVILVVVVLLGLFIHVSLKKKREAEERRRQERERQLQMEREKQMEYSRLYGQGAETSVGTVEETTAEEVSPPEAPPKVAEELAFKTPEDYKPKELDEIFK